MSISMRRIVERSTLSSSASLAIFFTCLAARRTGMTCRDPVRGRPRLRRLSMCFFVYEKSGQNRGIGGAMRARGHRSGQATSGIDWARNFFGRPRFKLKR